MNIQNWISMGSVIVSALAIVFSYLNTKLQLKHAFKIDKQNNKKEEREIVAQFLGYCKKAYTFGIKEEEMIEFSSLYIKTQAIECEELRQSITKCCNSVIVNSESLPEDFAQSLSLYRKYYKTNL